MPFSAGELANIANAALDYYIKGPALSQTIQDKPLVKALEEGKKEFPGGKEFISEAVKGDYTTALQGYNHNDTVTYGNPANIKRVQYKWYETHAGIGLTLTELKVNGVSVVDSAQGKSTTNHDEREVHVLTDLLEDKLEDMSEGWARSFNNMLWRDGSQDAKQVPGILSFLTTTPAVGTTGGLDRAANSWWRHRYTGGLSASATNQTLTLFLRSEARQLRRYAKNSKYKVLCGSAFIEALESEIHAKGYYTDSGFANKGKNEIGMATISMRGIGDFEYDPTLDDLSLSKHAFFIDTNAFKLRPMTGEDKKMHNPARPHNQYALYRAMTWTGALTVNQLNSSARYALA